MGKRVRWGQEGWGQTFPASLPQPCPSLVDGLVVSPFALQVVGPREQVMFSPSLRNTRWLLKGQSLKSECQDA